MQLSADLLTPFLPPYFTAKQRYNVLRKIVPNEYTFLEEIQRPEHELNISRKLIVLVHAIQCHSYCDWTVDLRDECGSHIKAWCSPTLVTREQEQPKLLRPAVVWCLQNVTILPSFEGELWLLLNEESFQSIWAAETVSDEAYLEWMGKREKIQSEQKDLDPGQEEDFSKAEPSRQDSSQSEGEDNDYLGIAQQQNLAMNASTEPPTEIGLPIIDVYATSFMPSQAQRNPIDDIFPCSAVAELDSHVPCQDHAASDDMSRLPILKPMRQQKPPLPTPYQAQQPPVLLQRNKSPPFVNQTVSPANLQASLSCSSPNDLSLPQNAIPGSEAAPQKNFVEFKHTSGSVDHQTQHNSCPRKETSKSKERKVDLGAFTARSLSLKPMRSTNSMTPQKEKVGANTKKAQKSSKLWEAAIDDDMIGIFDEENESIAMVVETTIEKCAPIVWNHQQIEESKDSKGPKSLEERMGQGNFVSMFDESNFGGMDMDDLFADD